MKTLYNCAICSTHTTVLHEVVFGTLYRETCIKGKLQMPLCQVCHDIAHGRKHGNKLIDYPNIHSYNFRKKTQHSARQHFCKILHTDHDKLIQAFKLMTSTFSKMSHKYIMHGKEKRTDIIKGFEV